MSTDAILNLGDDALVNQYQAVFPKGIPGGSNTDAVRLRIDQTFPMPSEDIATYEVNFRGSKLIQTAKKEDTDKTITFSVRVDQEWNVYDDLEAWRNLCYNPVNNTASPNSVTRVPIIIQNLNQSGTIVKSFTFTSCKIKTLKITDWDMGSAEPVRVEVTIIYGTMTSETA